MGKKYQVTLGNDTSGILEEWAKADNLPPGTIAARLLAEALIDARARNLFPSPDVKPDKTLGSGLRQITQRWVSDPELIELAHDASISVETLKTIRDCLHKNGEKTHVHQC